MSEMRVFGKAAGQVQGVGFRMFVRENARKLGLVGWVKNMDDGTVDFEVQGEEYRLQRLFEIMQAGNYFIKVKSLELHDRPLAKEPEQSFKIAY